MNTQDHNNDDTVADRVRCVCMGCGKKLHAVQMKAHQAKCARYQLECRLIAAQNKIKV
jgi:hypothetical protein